MQTDTARRTCRKTATVPAKKSQNAFLRQQSTNSINASYDTEATYTTVAHLCAVAGLKVVLISRIGAQQRTAERTFLVYARNADKSLSKWMVHSYGLTFELQPYTPHSELRDVMISGSFDNLARSINEADCTAPVIAPNILYKPLEEVEPL